MTDFAGSLNFITLAVMTLVLGDAYTPRQIFVTAVVVLSRAYLGGYLLYRVLQRGHDARFNEMRAHFFSFLAFWVFQMIWAFGVSLSVIYVNASDAGPRALGAADWAGAAVALLGLVVEAAGDLQKNAFRADEANKHKWCDVGLWAWSRHPPYFGEMLVWWGVFVMCIPAFVPSPAGFATVLAPLLTMAILLFLSGMPTAEGDAQRRFMRTRADKRRYLAYRDATPPIVLLPPGLYALFPLFAKRLCCCEYPMYECHFEPEEEGQDWG